MLKLVLSGRCLPWLLLLPAGLAAQTPGPTVTAYGLVTDHLGTPVPRASLVITGVDTSPGVARAEYVRVGWQCEGARPQAARVTAGADGRFRVALPAGEPPRRVSCLSIAVTPPPASRVEPLDLSMDSVHLAALHASGDSLLMMIVLPDREGAAAAPSLPEPPAFATSDDELRWLARTVPGGFGGYWRRPGADEVHVYLLDLAQAPRAKSLLVRYFQLRPPAGGTPRDVSFMQAHWDVPTLLGWRDRLLREGAAAGVRSAQLRPDWNRVQVSVRGDAGAARLRARLRVLGIPERALLIVGGRA